MRYAALVMSLPLLAGCASIANVRSAEVRPGPAVTLEATLAPSPGDDAGWFWSYDCATRCNHGIGAAELAVAFGTRPLSGPPFTLGFGVNGVFYPFAEAYLQLDRDPRLPLGIGGRLGLSPSSWNEHQLYHTGNSPNGANPGSFLGLVGGIGMEIGSGPVAVTPALSLVLGRSDRSSYGTVYGPVTQPFIMFSMALTFRGNRVVSPPAP